MANVFIEERNQVVPALPDPGHCDVTSAEEKLFGLPPFPAAATKLLSLFQNEDADLRLVKPVLASDPALTAELLRMANSPLFTVTSAIRSVEHAVALLGLERVRSLAVSVAVRRFSANTNDRDYRSCWEHSLVCASVSEEVADYYDVSKEDAHTAALLHDIGRIGLLKAYSQKYAPVQRAEYRNVGESLALERYLVGVDHCHSGSFLEKVWGLPKSLQLVAECHHGTEEPTEPRLTTVVRIACALADTLGFPEVRCHSQPTLESALHLLTDAAANKFTERLPIIKKSIEEKLAYFQS